MLELRPDSRYISRSLCHLVTTAEQTTAEDLGNGDGILVRGRHYRIHRLVPGDRIALGDYVFT